MRPITEMGDLLRLQSVQRRFRQVKAKSEDIKNIHMNHLSIFNIFGANSN